MKTKLTRAEYNALLEKKKLKVVSEVPKVPEVTQEPLQTVDPVVESQAGQLKDIFYKTLESQDLLIDTVERVLGKQDVLTTEIVAALRRPVVEGFSMVTPEGREYKVKLERS